MSNKYIDGNLYNERNWIFVYSIKLTLSLSSWLLLRLCKIYIQIIFLLQI